VNEKIRACVPPRLDELPRRRRELREPVVEVGLRTITPIYGGGVHTREVDAVDVIRVPSVRGQLRWWWRVLFAGEHEDPRRLFEAEFGWFGWVSTSGSRRVGGSARWSSMLISRRRRRRCRSGSKRAKGERVPLFVHLVVMSQGVEHWRVGLLAASVAPQTLCSWY